MGRRKTFRLIDLTLNEIKSRKYNKFTSKIKNKYFSAKCVAI